MGHVLAKLRHIRRPINVMVTTMLDTAISIATLPYYRAYQFNTSKPLLMIANLATQSTESMDLLRLIAFWRERKLAELQYVSIACTVLAAAVIGAFSWDTVQHTYWLTHGFWHSSLVLSTLGILLSASQAAALQSLGPASIPKRIHALEPDRAKVTIARYSPLLISDTPTGFVPRKKMLFTWQGPIMLMSYSACLFLAGLTVLVCSPLIMREGRGPGYNIAIMYLTVAAAAGPIFLFCSFWAYHYVDIDSLPVESEADNETANSPFPLKHNMRV
ncbi:unnamed protein product [Periconia digitata]|uniref:Uncharacterized protein n=1 Tax=Periconia digitata TaxID=1303443 RepID=A0A9W4UGD4_9PLEO|nr:unnamed protein product [Periconia digitata]